MTETEQKNFQSIAAVTWIADQFPANSPRPSDEVLVNAAGLQEVGQIYLPVLGDQDDVGPLTVALGLSNNRVGVQVFINGASEPSVFHVMGLAGLKRIFALYSNACEQYVAAITGHMNPSMIETHDMARRGLHNEGAAFIQDKLADKITIDHETARKLFGLIHSMHAATCTRNRPLHSYERAGYEQPVR